MRRVKTEREARELAERLAHKPPPQRRGLSPEGAAARFLAAVYLGGGAVLWAVSGDGRVMIWAGLLSYMAQPPSGPD